MTSQLLSAFAESSTTSFAAGDISPEDRLEQLIDPNCTLGMRGFRESLLTKILCVMQPDRFLPILTYASPAGGKREVAASVFAP